MLFVHAWNTADPTTRITQIPDGVFYALLAELNWRFLRRARGRIAVNSEGIWHRQGSGAAFIAWNDLASVRANDAQQRLELRDRRDVTFIRIDYRIGKFEELRAYILSHSAAKSQLERADSSIFHHSAGNQLVYAMVAAIAFVFAWWIQHHSGHMVIAPLLFGVFMLFMVLREPTTLVIGHDGIAIHYLGYRRDIAFESIADIDFKDVRYRGNVFAGVRIATSKGARIQLTRFREGSIALYEALQAAWRVAAAAKGRTLPTALTAPGTQSVAARRSRPWASRSFGFALLAIVITAIAMVGGLGRTKAGKALSETSASRAQMALNYPRHPGPVAQLSQLRGSGTVYLVQMGENAEPYSLADFAKWLHDKYAIDVQVLPAMAIDRSAWDARRHQFVAEQLEAQMKQRHSDLALNNHAYLIGFTDADMYSTNEMWISTFSERDGLRAAIISSDGMGDSAWQRAHLSASGAIDRFRDRMRRILLRDVAVLYWHLPVNYDASSLLHYPLDPDLPIEDIYESDLDPALSPEGEHIDEPCVFFTYSDKDGIALLPGPVVRGCGQIQDPMEDESVEVFEVALRFGLLIDLHTDLYLPDTIPIEFQRATRDGNYGKRPFGISGSDNYDEMLGSADNIHIFMESGEGKHVDMIRVPEWLPVLPLVKYVGGESTRAWVEGAPGRSQQTVWQYQMAWHALPYEHYDVQRFNGGMRTFLPCGSVAGLDCMLVDYHDSQGRELKIDRDSLRRLTRITSPNGSWVGVSTANDRRILAAFDSKGRTVLYGYDAARDLTSVTYPSGEVYQYTYDAMQHILSVNVAANAQAAPRMVLRNEYENKLLTKMALPDGSVYSFDYNSSDRMAIHRATIHTPDGRIFNVGIGDAWTTVRETHAPAAAAHK